MQSPLLSAGLQPNTETDMNYQKLTQGYMLSVFLVGCACVAFSIVNLSYEKLDIPFFILAGCTIGFGSRISIQIPRFKSHISVSDTFIFLSLLLYGGETAIILAGFEAFFSARRFCNERLTVLFNAGVMALSTSVVVAALRVLGMVSESQLHGHRENFRDFIIALCVIAVTQFVVNTSLASVYDALQSALPLWETWKSKYIWTFFTYLVGAVGAGILVQLVDYFGFGVLIATFPIILFVFLSYKMYLKNVEMSIEQAEQAEQYANELRERSAALRDSEQRFRSAFNYAPIGIALVSPSGQWLKVNRALCEILGYDPDEFLASDFQSMIFPNDLGATLVRMHELASGKIENCQMEHRYIHKSGRTVWASWSVSSASETPLDNSNLIFQIQDITDKKLAEEKLMHEATHDELTGLPNRSLFIKRLAEGLQKSRLDPKYNVSVLFIDLDRFKYVNDSLGHHVGDQLLVAISERLCECMRAPDIVARIGGDEFVVLVEGRYFQEKATKIAERIQRKFSMPFNLGGHEVYSSASIGILHASEKHLTSDDIMRDADTAMYHAKRAGKARHEVFDEDMHAAVKETLLLETDLRRAIEKEELTVQYQPIFALATGEVLGFEALARWEHPELGDIPPSKFIPLAEEIGRIDVLGEHSLRKACSEIGPILNSLPELVSLKLSVNLSCKQFAHPTLVERIRAILYDTRFSPLNLKLEITESVFFEYQEKAIEMLHQLRAFGIGLDIDDFGTGYSNLSYLVRLPISTLKIDRSFIKPIDEEGANTEIVKTIITLARNLNLKVIAEGIETNAQLEALKNLDCEGGQGYLLARPMSAEEVREFLRENLAGEVPAEALEDVSVLSTLQ